MNVSNLYRPTIDEMVQALVQENEVFRKLFNSTCSWSNLIADEQTVAEESFRTLFPEEPDNFQSFLQRWQTHQCQDLANECSEEDRIEPCADYAFDPQTRKKQKVTFLNPSRRSRRREDFNVYGFISKKENDMDCFRLDVNSNLEDVYLDVPFEERALSDSRTDQCLRKMGRILILLNQNSSFRILDYQSVSRIAE